MLINEIEKKFPNNFHSLQNLSDYSSWREKGLKHSTISIFPNLLTLDELFLYIDNANKDQIANYRNTVQKFIINLSSSTDAYCAAPFKNKIKKIRKENINIRTCIRFFEECKINIFLPELKIAIRGGDDFSANIVYTKSIPETLKNTIKQSNLYLL